MASESSPPTNPADDKTQNPVTQIERSSNQTQQDASINPPSVFINSEPMREEQVQNAMKFLSHPRVRGSPVIYRRSFLEKKGLTKEEIDEAFRRVPDPPPSAQATDPNQEGQMKPASSVQPSATTQALQPVVASPSGGISSTGTLVQSRFHWYHAVFAVGILAVSGAGTAVLIKNAIIPWLKSWIRKVAAEEEEDGPAKNSKTKPSLAEETAAAAKAAAASVADVATASQEMLNSKNEDKRYLADVMKLLDAQLQEMKSLRTSIDKLEGQTNSLVRTSLIDREDHAVSVSNTKQTYANGKTESDLRSVRSSSPASSAEPSVAPHPKSYMEIMAMIQRGEKPSNIRDINDQPPNPKQPITNPRLAPRTKPWEVAQGQNGSSQVFRSQPSGDSINNKVQNDGVNYQLNVESTAPWWQRTAKVTEIENEDDFRAGPYGRQANERPVQRTWVPPQPPSVAMREAAEAIRRPKPSVQKERLADSESLASSTEATNEYQKTTKVSESGGAVEIKGEESRMNSSEILEVEEQSY